LTDAQKVAEAKRSACHLATVEVEVLEKTTPIKSSYVVMDGLVQRKQQYRADLFINTTTKAYLDKHYPNVQMIPCKDQNLSLHPIINMGRSMGEKYAIATATRKLDKMGILLKDGVKIVDVGGNASRHHNEGRKHIHSCSPILSPADVLRNENHRFAPNRCNCKAEECSCVEPAAYLSVDSAYYLTPQVIGNLCYKATSKMMYVVMHEFDDAYGTFGGGEATYQLVDLDRVSMSVEGNDRPYVHSSMSWIRQQYPVVMTPGGPRTVVWQTLCKMPTHTIFQFTVTDIIFTQDPIIEMPLVSTLQSPDFYGDISLAGVFNDQGKASVPGEAIILKETRVISWGPSIFIYQPGTKLVMHAPKGLVDEAALWVAGRDRTSDCLKNLIVYLKSKSKAYNMPPGILATSLVAAAHLGFCKNIIFETSVMHGVTRPMLPTMAVHHDGIMLKFKMVWTKPVLAAAILAAGAVSGLTLGTIGILAGPVVAISAGAAAAAAAATAFLAKHVQHLCTQQVPQTASFKAFPGYHADRSSDPPGTCVKMLPPGINLPATDSCKTAEELAAMEMDPSATVRPANDLTENREKPDKGPLKPGGIVSTFSIPVVPANSSLQSLHAIKSRITKKGPSGKGLVDDKFFSLFEQYVMDNLEDFGLGKDSVKAEEFEVWNQHYPAHMQRRHVEAKAQLNDANFKELLVHERGEFMKVEPLSKSTPDGAADFAPRAIQSGTPHHNVATGPFCKGFSKRLAEIWSIMNDKGPMYTSKASAEQIGSAFQRAVRRLDGDMAILEGDFARFDSTIHRRLLELEARIYKYVGCSDQAYAAFMSCILTKGRDKFGTRYGVDGGRHSGDHNTSCGNTLLQVLAIMFCMSFEDAQETGILLPPTQLVAKLDITLLALGDDNLLVGRKEFLQKIPMAPMLLKLGLELEPKLHDTDTAKYHATFCSSRFWPVEGDMTVLGPGVGRGVARGCWYVNPPDHVSLQSMVRADSIGRIKDCAFIPFLRLLWRRNHELTRGETIYMSREQKRSALHNNHAAESHQACAETWQMLEVVYNLTPQNEATYGYLLDQAKSLPAIVNYEPLAAAIKVDGVGSSDMEVEYEAVDTSAPLGQMFSDIVNRLIRKPSIKPTRSVRFTEIAAEESLSSVEMSNSFIYPFDF
jgi:hypothetical protein